MNIRMLGRAAAGLTLITALPGVAFAQAATEIIGQPIQVTTNGVTNTVYLDPGGSAQIMTPGGQHRSGDLAGRQRPALPQQRRRAGMLALQRRRSRPASR